MSDFINSHNYEFTTLKNSNFNFTMFNNQNMIHKQQRIIVCIPIWKNIISDKKTLAVAGILVCMGAWAKF